ncbi:hypothetical protein AKG11_29575 [Shinella sp. SUS2]|nr:hypothetical protein AKG11_29575 [Shinella sp. SUS2]KOC71669.1 hypothetical protein AKG10_31675 [Shinella sp. GWS1]
MCVLLWGMRNDYGSRWFQSTGTRTAAGTFDPEQKRRRIMNNIIYLVGLVVVVIAVLSFFGLG